MGRGMTWLIAIIIALVLGAFYDGIVYAFTGKERNLAKSVALIQQALFDYKVAKNTYPSTLAELVQGGFLKEYGRNPYGKKGSVMQEVEFAQRSPGNVTYLPLTSPEGEIVDFLMLIHGPDPEVDAVPNGLFDHPAPTFSEEQAYIYLFMWEGDGPDGGMWLYGGGNQDPFETAFLYTKKMADDAAAAAAEAAHQGPE